MDDGFSCLKDEGFGGDTSVLRALSRGFRYFYRTSWFILMPGIHTHAVSDLADKAVAV